MSRNITALFLICIFGLASAMQAEDLRGADALKQKDEDRARRESRVTEISKQFGKLRMVIGGPCPFYGIDPIIVKDLKEAGMEVLAYPDAPLLAPGESYKMCRDPMEYNIIIFGEPLLAPPDPSTGQMPEKIVTAARQLKRFVEEGGGLWLSGLGEYENGQSAFALNYIMKELGLGAEVAPEVVEDTAAPEKSKLALLVRGSYARVNVLANPLTDGVKELIHPVGVCPGFGVVPIIKLSPEWQVLVQGKDTAASFRVSTGTGPLSETPGTVKSSPVLVAVRQIGKGRVVLWPTWSCFTVTGGSWGPVIAESDGGRLIENLLCWLAEPSQGSKTVGVFDAEKAEVKPGKIDPDAILDAWCKPGMKDYACQFKGIIGAHSTLSDGKSQPGEMIEAARKAGYSFIAFTENFAKMDEEKWKKLLAVCDRANKEMPDFRAYPGLDFLDEAGNRCVVFGNRYWIKDEWRSKKHPDRIQWWGKLTWFGVGGSMDNWSPRVIIRSKTNNKRPWNQGLWSLFAPYCYEGGKLVDDSLDEWAELIGRYGYLGRSILAVHTVYTAGEVTAAAQPGFYQTWVRTPENFLPQVLDSLSGQLPRPCYVSQGPEIEAFSAQAVPEIWSVDMAIPGNRNVKLHVLVKSPAGLKEIEVYNNNRLARRFKTEDKIFDKFLTFHGEVGNSFYMVATDRDGHKAASWPSQTMVWELRAQGRCGDNQNYAMGGKGPGSLKPYNISYSHLESTIGWGSGDKGKKTERPRYQCGGAQYGNQGLGAACDCIISDYDIRDKILVDGKAWPGGYTSAMLGLNFDTGGRYGTIVTNCYVDDIIDFYPGGGEFGAFTGCFEVRPSPWPTRKKGYIPFRKPDGAEIGRVQSEVSFTKEITTKNAEPVTLRLNGNGNPQAGTVEIMRPDGWCQQYEVDNDGKIDLEIPEGGYACWYDDQGNGVGGMIPFSPGTRLSYTKKHALFYMLIPTPIKPGTKVTWDCIFISGNDSTSGSNRQVRDVWRGMGIAGSPTLYTVKPRLGKIVDQKFFLTLQPDDYGFSGVIARTTDRELPIHLPVFIKGLNPRWDAGLWYRGKTCLHTVNFYQDRWGVKFWERPMATYEPRVDELRDIPVLDGGAGYCQVETDKQAADVFIGNFLVCDRPEVFLTMVKAKKGECTFEINNPTDEELTCTVRPSKGFEFIGEFKETVLLAPGAFKSITVSVE